LGRERGEGKKDYQEKSGNSHSLFVKEGGGSIGCGEGLSMTSVESGQTFGKGLKRGTSRVCRDRGGLSGGGGGIEGVQGIHFQTWGRYQKNFVEELVRREKRFGAIIVWGMGGAT